MASKYIIKETQFDVPMLFERKNTDINDVYDVYIGLSENVL